MTLYILSLMLGMYPQTTTPSHELSEETDNVGWLMRVLLDVKWVVPRELSTTCVEVPIWNAFSAHLCLPVLTMDYSSKFQHVKIAVRGWVGKASLLENLTRSDTSAACYKLQQAASE